MYNSRVKQYAYELKRRGLNLEGALASLYVGRLSLEFNKKQKFIKGDLRVQFVSIGGHS
ncbi:hypothetical protein [Bacillus toyonensis]|uniref:hypothetical protein n=1 Tax=Bacillus toyonensis TaxID=155322 RepID=UPI0015CEFD7B|nr:hypothetical protein [Bacillus toyonensis]